MQFTVTSTSPKNAHSNDVQKIAELEGPQELFWLLEQNLPAFHALVAEIEGATEINQRRNALRAVLAKYPSLSASITKVPGERPYFVKRSDLEIPLSVRVWTDSLVLHEEVGARKASRIVHRQLNQGFGDGSGSLVRVTLFHGEKRSALLVAVHHSPLDGKSTLLILQDLLASMTGELIGESKEALLTDPLLGLPVRPTYSKKLNDGIVVAPPDGLLVGLPPIGVCRLVLGEEETARRIRKPPDCGG